MLRISLMLQWLRICLPMKEFNPWGWGTKIPYAEGQPSPHTAATDSTCHDPREAHSLGWDPKVTRKARRSQIDKYGKINEGEMLAINYVYQLCFASDKASLYSTLRNIKIGKVCLNIKIWKVCFRLNEIYYKSNCCFWTHPMKRRFCRY